MKTCEEHGVVYEQWQGRDKRDCPVCDAEKEIKRHEITNEILREIINEIKALCSCDGRTCGVNCPLCAIKLLAKQEIG